MEIIVDVVVKVTLLWVIMADQFGYENIMLAKLYVYDGNVMDKKDSNYVLKMTVTVKMIQ